MSLEAFRRNRAEEKKHAIIDAATRLFSEQGLKAVSMARLAEAAGVSTATVYRHFDTKEDIFASVVRHLVDDVIVEAAEAALQAKDPLRELCVRYAGLLSDPVVLGCLRAVVAEPDSGFREHLATHGNTIFLNEFQAEIRQVLAGTDADPMQAGIELRGAIEHFTLVPGLLFHETPDAEQIELMVDRTLTSWRQRYSGSMIGTQLAR